MCWNRGKLDFQHAKLSNFNVRHKNTKQNLNQGRHEHQKVNCFEYLETDVSDHHTNPEPAQISKK
jgi:hypothetical protein